MMGNSLEYPFLSPLCQAQGEELGFPFLTVSQGGC